ncbi:MAG: EAL domain-containing protein [Gammaproteobacteria bacterium]|nr:EAL domain-containing protein [Gammaproteobacteria bacterium]NIR31202.1 EAL domain-containing protein [Gammaproteobacteria bacterium]NIR98691.1 EAL domain-containing protein [Gammaproteobacteria bacterium]NIT64406.1 EAL domain-containing protein [Gammaproteobacteria bacterium]NIV21331.1 EAL domain-containing protein [Gammaproteobacteria bacterium]
MVPSQFLRLADALPEVLILISTDAQLLAANRAAGRFLGIAPRQLVGRSLFELVKTPETVVRKHIKLWHRTRTPIPAPLIWKVRRHAEGGWRCHAFLLQPSEGGQPAYIALRCIPGRRSAGEFQALNRELERQRGTLRKLQESREELALAHEKAAVTLHSIGDAVVTTDQDGIIEYMNPIAEGLVGWTTSEARGRPLLEVFNILNEDTREPADDPVARCLREGTIVGLANHTVLIARDGTEYVIEDSAAPIRSAHNRLLGAVLVFRDVTEERLVQRQLRYLAQRDTLTGLYNRHYFEQELGRAVQVARRGTLGYAMFYMDLDQFKLINDTVGHGAGDEMLREVGEFFFRRLRQSDVLARLGGDEFGVLLNGVGADKAMEIADDLQRSMEAFDFTYQGVTYEISTSIGIAMIGAQTVSSAEVLRHADIACYVAKRQGRSCNHLYSESDDVDLTTIGEMKLLADIKTALAQDRFVLHFQPIQPLAGRGDPLYEVLVRMLDDQDQLVGPGTIIPTAERYGLMTQIDKWVVERALGLLAERVHDGRPIRLSVNLSGTSAGAPELLDAIRNGMHRLDVPPGRLIFEVTETAAIAVAHIEKAEAFMRELRAAGCRFALDDFGTGFSSFTYLKYLPVDYIKIDGTFVRDILSDPVDQAMVRSINQIAHSLGKQTIAEFVENEEVRKALVSFGVDYAQGYHIGRPGPELP